MRPTVRKADESDARVVHDMISAIAWINEDTKSADGFAKVREFCRDGHIFVSAANSQVAAVMILRKDRLAAEFGRNLWSIPLITTVAFERRKGHARMLIRKAKEVSENGMIQAYAQNDKSKDLLVSEGFIHIDGEADERGYPLYQWSPA